MTKKHFNKLALAIAFVNNDDDRKKLTENIEAICKEANPRFSKQSFRNAIDEELWKRDFANRN